MKKDLFIIAATAMIFTACSNEKLLNNNVNEASVVKPIGFEAFANKATKADNNSDLNFFYDAFKVSGWKYTTEWNNVFTKQTNEYFDEDTQGAHVYVTAPAKPSDEWASAANLSTTPAWYYEGVRYWDKFATKYQFGAYAPIDAANVEITNNTSGDDCVITMGSSADKFTVENTNLMATPSKTLAYEGFTTDFMTAVAHTGGNTSTSPVSLIFKHELAKFDIKLKLNPDVITNQKVIVKEVTFHNIYSKSYYDSSKETETDFLSGWAKPTDEYQYSVKGVGNTSGYQLNLDIDNEHDGDQNYDDYYVFESLMIPQIIKKATNAAQLGSYDTNKEASLYVKYSIGDEDFVGYYALANMFITNTDTEFKLEGGNEYILTITVGPAPIYFTPTVTPWAENTAETDI